MGWSEYEAYLSELEQKRRRQSEVAAALHDAHGVNPDERARLQKLGQKAQVPTQWLSDDEDLRRQAERSAFLRETDPEALAEKYPGTAELLSDPENAKAMHDDVDALKGLETLITGIGTMSGGKVMEGLYGLFKSGRGRTVAKAMGEGIGNSPALVNEALARTGQMAAEFVDWSLQAFPDPTNMRKRVSQRIKESADYWKYAAKERQTEWKPGTAESYVQQAGQSIGTSLLAAPFGIGGEGAALTMFGLFGSGGYETMREAGKSVPEAAVMSTSNRIMEGLTEKIGLDRLYKGTGPILKKAVQFVLGDVAGEEINTLYNAAVDKVTVNPDMTMADVVQQVVDTAIVTGIAAPVQGGTFHGAARASEYMYDRYVQNQRTKYTVDFLSALGDSVGASKSFERLPEKVQELIKRLKEKQGGAIDNVYMPADAWSMLWQDSNVDPAQMAEEVMGNRQDYLDALAAGGDLVIPLEDFVTLTKTGKYEDILQDVKLSQGDMTARQYEEAKKTEEEDIKSILESVKGEEDTTDKAIFNDVMGQLLGTGMERSTAESQAALWQSTMRTMATRAGLDPIDLYRKYNPRIVRPLPEVLTNRLRVDMQLDPILDRLRAGDMPKEAEMFGPSLGEFVRSKGGLVDAAGELKSLGAGKLIKKDGMELDRAREQAAEAGYLPEDATVRDFLDALDNELRGKPIYAPGNQNDKLVDERQTLDQMREFLEQSGIDLNEVDNEQARKVLGQGVLWQEGNTILREDKRGFFDLSANVIGLLKGADLSTFLHESGHFYFKVLQDLASDENAPQQTKDDYATLLKWFGTDKPEVKHLEMFAEGFEQYLGEGKAPTPELQSIFWRFKDWILHVYKTLKAFKVPLTDEVRGVFDRMVASDEELAAARDEAFAKPIFATAEDAGMTETEFNAYLADAINANEREATRLKKQLMAEFYREQKRWKSENRAILRQEVEAEAKENPVYEVLQVLMTGKQFDGSESPLGAFKLSKDELVGRYGKDFLKRLPKAFGSIYSIEGGTSVDLVAEAYGFASGDELVQKLIEAPKMKEWIEEETDRRMRAEFGDDMTDGTLADEAMAAIHSDDRAKMLRAELAAIRKKQREVKPYTDAAKADAKKHERQIQKEREYERRWLEAEKNLAIAIERGAMQAEIERLRQEKRTAEAMRRAARQGMYGSVPSVETFKLAAMLSIGNKKIWQINPDYYFRGEQKAAREAFDAAAKGDYAAAGEAKQRQLLNHYLYREARQAKADAEKIYEHVKDVQGKPGQERLAKAGNGFLQQVNALLERYQFRKTTNKELDERGSLKAWVEKMEQEGLMFPISDEILDSATTVNYREATVDELRAFNDALRILEGAAKMWRQFNTSVDQREWEDVEHELYMGLVDADLGSTKELNRPNDKAFTLKDKGAKQWRRFDAAHMKMEQIVDWLDGGEINGPWARYFFDQADRAQTLEYDYHARITAKLQELNDSMPKQWLASLFDKTPLEGVDLPNMDGRDATRFTLISIALNTGNEGNLQRLMDGNGWTENEINEALDKLNAEDWKYIQGVWDVVNSLWPDIVSLQERVCGLPPKKVEAREITNRHGTFRGGYFPIAFDPFTKQGEKQAQATESVESFMGLRYGKATTATGHLKERAQKVNSALLLDFEQVITRHMSSVIKDLSHREAVFNLNRILRSENIKAMLKDKLGEDYYRNMKEWLQTLINDRAETYKQNLMFWPAVMRTIRTNTAIVTMGWKISTFLTQFAGFGPSVDVVGYGAYMKALTRFMLHPKQTWEEISDKSGEMRHRANTIDRDIKEELLRLRGVTGKMAAIKRTAFYLTAMSDRMVSIPTWLAGYANAQKENLSEADCIRAGDRAVRMSQGGGGAKDLAGVQRQEQFMKLVTMYYTPFSVLYARLRDVGHTTHGVKDLPRAVARSIALVILPAVMGELLAGRGPDDDEDKVWWVARKTVLYPFQAVPIIRDLANLYEPIMAAMGGAPAKWRPGYKMSPIEDSAMKVWRAISNLDDAWEGDKEWDDVAWDMFEASGYIFGLPTAQVRITGEYLYDLLTDGDNTDNISGVVFRRRK